mgnify:CR=1 FL=1
MLNNEEFKFKVCKSMMQPHDINVVSTIDIIEEGNIKASIEGRFTLWVSTKMREV